MSTVIEGVVAGDDLDIEAPVAPRLNTETGLFEGGVIPTDPLVKAWFTIKERLHPEVNDPGALQKVITTAQVPGLGQIVQDGSEQNGNGTASLLFQLTAAETLALGTAIRYYWDIQVKTSSGKIFTVSDPMTGETVGRIQFRQGVTAATT